MEALGCLSSLSTGWAGIGGDVRNVWGVFLGVQAVSNKLFNPSPDAELVKANQQLSANLGEVTNRLHQEVGKSAFAADVLVNAVHTREFPASIVEEAKARKPSSPKVTHQTKTGQVTTTPATKKTPSTGAGSPSTTGLASQSTATGNDYPALIWDIQAPTAEKSIQTPTDYTLIVPDDRRAHHQLYQRFGRAIYDPWWRPPEHLKTMDPYHFRLSLMAPTILASLEQEHPPAA